MPHAPSLTFGRRRPVARPIARCPQRGIRLPALPVLPLLVPVILVVALLAATTRPARAQGMATIPFLPRHPGGPPHFVGVSIGDGPAVPVSIDTGSAGLYVFERDIGPDVQRTPVGIHQGYVDGTRFEGYVGLATVRFPGTSLGSGKIAIGVITRVYCAPERPRCPGSDQKPGVMGVGMDTGGRLASPFAQLPGAAGGAFVVDARRGMVPRIVLGPSPDTMRSFRFASLRPGRPSTVGRPSWDSGSARGCYRVNGEAASCQAIIFDTGQFDSVFDPGPARSFRVGPHGFLLPGQLFELDVPGALALRVDTDRSMFILPKATPRSNIGTLVFRYAAIAFDARNGRIGFRQ